MQANFETHLMTILRGEFPEHAELHERREGGDLCLYADWKLGTDPERPNKRSRKIKAILSEEAVDDYTTGNERQRKNADATLREIIARRLKSFDPEHSVPAHVPVPIEEWIITTAMLNI